MTKTESHSKLKLNNVGPQRGCCSSGCFVKKDNISFLEEVALKTFISRLALARG